MQWQLNKEQYEKHKGYHDVDIGPPDYKQCTDG